MLFGSVLNLIVNIVEIITEWSDPYDQQYTVGFIVYSLVILWWRNSCKGWVAEKKKVEENEC